MEDKKIRKLHIIHNCGECIFHEKIELSKHTFRSVFFGLLS